MIFMNELTKGDLIIYEDENNKIEIEAFLWWFYQKVTDIFAECSIDYNKNSEIAKEFYSTIQNKFHYAITNETVAKIIYHRANSKKEHMGLTSYC